MFNNINYIYFIILIIVLIFLIISLSEEFGGNNNATAAPLSSRDMAQQAKWDSMKPTPPVIITTSPVPRTKPPTTTPAPTMTQEENVALKQQKRK